MIRFACPGCGAVHTADDAAAGRPGKCPGCAAEYQVPGPPGEPVEAAPCPRCGGRLAVAPKDFGTEVECPHCRQPFVAARPAPPPPPASYREPDPRPARRADDRPGPWPDKPGQVTAIGGMLLGGGIYALVQASGVALGSGGVCCLWPGTAFAVVWGILAIVRSTAALGAGDRKQGSPKTLLTLQVLQILNLDVINCLLGVVGLVLLKNPELREYYGRPAD